MTASSHDFAAPPGWEQVALVPLPYGAHMMLFEERRPDCVWLHLLRGALEAPDSFRCDARGHLSLPFREFEDFARAISLAAVRLGYFAQLPDFAALAARYRRVDCEEDPCQRNVTLARLFAALAAQGDARDSPLLREIDRVVAKHYTPHDAPEWALGAPSLSGSGVEPTAKLALLQFARELFALDDAALDQRVEAHRNRDVPLTKGAAPRHLDRDEVIARELMSALRTRMPHLDATRAAGVTVPVKRGHAVATLPVLDHDGQRRELIVTRVAQPEREGDAAPEDPNTHAVTRLAQSLREMRRSRSQEARGEPQETFLRPDDAEAVLRMALRFAGLEPSKAEGFFKFLDMQAKRNGAADTAGNRDRRRRAQKEKRKK